MQSLKGKVAVITGAGSGIGLAIANRAAREGMRLVLADIEQSALDKAAQEMNVYGVEYVTVATDVSRADDMKRLEQRTLDRYGTVHLVINNAGVGGGGCIWELEQDYWEWVLGVNLWGVIHGVRRFTPHLVAQNEGHIVNTASIAGLMSAPDTGPYTVSKHAVVALSEVLAGDLRRAGADGVGVSVLCPSFVDTRIYAAERNRPLPEAVRADPRWQEEQRAIEEMAATLFSAAMSADKVADMVMEAVRENRFYVLTHPEGTREQVRRRMQCIIDGKAPDLSGPEDYPV